MNRLSLCAGIAAILTAACDGPPGPPIAGGPCSYETQIITGTVIEVDDDGAMFDGADGEFWVPAEYLGEALPSLGDTLTLSHEQIIEGTCTPDIYTVIPPGD